MPPDDDTISSLSDQVIKLNALNQEQAKRIRDLTARCEKLAESNNQLRQENKGLTHGLNLAGQEIERLKVAVEEYKANKDNARCC